MYCTNCGKGLKIGNRSEMNSKKRKKVAWFFIGLVIVSAIGGLLYVAEQASLPEELRVEIERVKWLRELPDSIQLDFARQEGVTVEELLTSPYNRWAPKVFVGLLSAYAFAWVIYLAYSFFRFVDREGPTQTTSKQLLL
jgi:hypothetical protein